MSLFRWKELEFFPITEKNFYKTIAFFIKIWYHYKAFKIRRDVSLRGLCHSMTLNKVVRCRICGKNTENQEEIKMNALELISNSSIKSDAPKFEVGDTVKVHVRIKEGDKSRIQIFEGTVIAKKHGGISETFTVRRVAHGCGIERVFPLHSPVVSKVEVIRHGKVRRAKLYYLRDRVGKAAKVKEQIK